MKSRQRIYANDPGNINPLLSVFFITVLQSYSFIICGFNDIKTNFTKKIIIMESAMGKPFISSSEILWESVDKGVERKILGYDDNLMMVCVRFEKGAIGTLHHHVHRQISYVEAGRFEVSIDGAKKILEQGDCLFVAPNLVHGVVALEQGLLVDIFTPARQDFL